MNKFKLTCHHRNTAKLRDWLAYRGGIAVWPPLNLSNPTGQWLTPADAPRPTWQAAMEPVIITHAYDVGVYESMIFKVIKVALRRSSNGLSMKLTDGSQRKLDRAMAACKAAHGDAFFETGGLDPYPAVTVMYATKLVPLLPLGEAP